MKNLHSKNIIAPAPLLELIAEVNTFIHQRSQLTAEVRTGIRSETNPELPQIYVNLRVKIRHYFDLNTRTLADAWSEWSEIPLEFNLVSSLFMELLPMSNALRQQLLIQLRTNTLSNETVPISVLHTQLAQPNIKRPISLHERIDLLTEFQALCIHQQITGVQLNR